MNQVEKIVIDNTDCLKVWEEIAVWKNGSGWQAHDVGGRKVYIPKEAWENSDKKAIVDFWKANISGGGTMTDCEYNIIPILPGEWQPLGKTVVTLKLDGKELEIWEDDVK